MVELTSNEIDPAVLLEQVQSTRSGATVLFLGTTREITGQCRTESLDYTAYSEMARTKLEELEASACGQWPLTGCTIVHRLGHLKPGEASVAVAVSAPHRREAFEACQWLIDFIKQVVPIWKQENWEDGTSQWVHPGIQSPIQEPTAE